MAKTLDEQIAIVDAAIPQLEQLEQDTVAKLDALRNLSPIVEPTGVHRAQQEDGLKQRLRDIREGTPVWQRMNEMGVDTWPDIAAILTPLIHEFRLAHPGLASLRRLREELEAQRSAAADAADSASWPRPYRYVGPPHKVLLTKEGRYLQPGEIRHFRNAEQVRAAAGVFEPVTEPLSEPAPSV